MQMALETIRDGLTRLFTDDPVNWVKWAIVFAVFIGSYVVLIRSKSVDRLYHKWERKRQKAERMGHVVEGRLVKFTRAGSDSGDSSSGAYEYEIDGVIREHRAIFDQYITPPQALRLYYINNPDRPFSTEEYHWDGFRGCLLVILNFTPFLIGAFMVWLLGIDISGF